MKTHVLHDIRQTYAIDRKELGRVGKGDMVVISLLGLQAPQVEEWAKRTAMERKCLVFASYSSSALRFAAMGFNEKGEKIVDQHECTQGERYQTNISVSYKVAISVGCPSVEFQKFVQAGDFDFIIIFGLQFSRTRDISATYDVNSLLHSMACVKPWVGSLPPNPIHVVFANPIGAEGIQRYPGTSAVLIIQHGNIYASEILPKSGIDSICVRLNHRKWLLELREDGSLKFINYKGFIVSCMDRKVDRNSLVDLSLPLQSPEILADLPKMASCENGIDAPLPRLHRDCTCIPPSLEEFSGIRNVRPPARPQSPKRFMESFIIRPENSNNPSDILYIDEPSKTPPNVALPPLLNIPLSPFLNEHQDMESQLSLKDRNTIQ